MHYDDCVGVHDMQSYCRDRIRTRTDLAPLQKKVFPFVAASIAVADKHLADDLCEAELDQVLNPAGILGVLREHRGWQPNSVRNFWNGQLIKVDGVELHHSACCSEKELIRRIWNAQVQVLFPLIEDWRQDIIAKLEEDYRSWFMKDANLADWEFAKLNDYLVGNLPAVARSSRQAAALRSVTGQLRDIRNKIAHLKIVDSRQLRELEDIDWQIKSL